jgi:hypothetical protein
MHRFAGVFFSLILIALAATARTSAQDNGSAKITTPKAGDPLFGLVSIQGTASNPNMQRYILEFDSQDNDVDRWFLIAGPITQQVRDGVLAQWNTSAIPDGRYQIRLRVVLRDGTVLSDIVQNLRVNNKQPTPLPTSLPSATPVPPTAPPTSGPSPTPFIQQPPTNTARPALPTVPPTNAPPIAPVSFAPDAPQSVLALDALQNAFCGGASLAIIAFAVLGAYSLVHVRVRRFIRQIRNG